MANRAIIYRLYPTASQKLLLTKTFGCCRFVYNRLLSVQQERYKNGEKHLSRTHANNFCNRQLKSVYPFLREVDKFALTNAIYHLEDGYQRFFKHLGNFPKFKSKRKATKAYTTNSTNGNIKIGEQYIKLPKLGRVKAKIHRKPKEDWLLKSATVREFGDGTYQVSVLFEYEETPVSPVPVTEEQVIGLDYKSAGLYTDSNGKCQNMPGYFRMAQKELAKRQRKLRHKVPGSKNYRKQQKRIARVYRHISNQRKDYLHKLSTATAKQYAYGCVEDLNMRSMSNRINMSEKEGKYIMQAEEFINIVYNSGYATKKNAKKYTEKHPKDSYSDQDFIDVYRFNEEKKEIDHTHCTMSPIMNGKTTAFRNGIRGNNSSGQDWIG